MRIAPFLGTALLTAALAAQSPCFDLANVGTDLQMSDDDLVQGLSLGFTFTYNGVGYTSVCVESNGSIYLGATTSAFPDYQPDLVTLANSPEPRICPLWTDFNASDPASGHIYFNALPASGGNPAYALITWAGVFEFGQTTPIEVQVKLDANSTVTVTYGPQAAIGGALNSNVLIGACPGLGATPTAVSFATRPVVIAQNNFAHMIALPGAPAGVQMRWQPTSPGYVVTDQSCTPNGFPTPATAEEFGVGCPTQGFPTLYEVFTGSTDLSGLDYTFLPNGQGGYIVIQGIAGPMVTGLTNNLGATDDSSHAVALPFAFPHGLTTTTDIWVSSNGFLTFGPIDPGSGCCSGDPFFLLFGESMAAAYWSDLNPGAGGGVLTGVDPLSGDFVVAWNNVPEFPAAGSNTFQIALEPTGSFKIRLGALQNNGHQFLTGYSYGHEANDPGPTDLSALSVYDTGPLTLIQTLTHVVQFGSRPQLGSTFSTDTLGISPAPQGNLTGMMISFAELVPPADMGFVGAAGCTLYQIPAPDSLQFFNLTSGSPSTTFNISIPVIPALAGISVVSQTFSDDANANALGWKISNAIRWHLSNL